MPAAANPIISNKEPLVRLMDVDLEPGDPLHGIPYRTRVRWAITGVRGVKLEYVRRGHCIYTSSAATVRFLTAMNTPADQGPPPAPTAAATDADRRLAAAGL